MTTNDGTHRLKWERMQKRDIPLNIIADHYLAACRTEGKTPKTLRAYHEKLGRFVRWLGGTLDDFTIEAVREYIATLQAAEKWQDHRLTPSRGEPLSGQTIANHVRVVKGFSTWLYEEQHTKENVLARLVVPKAPRHITDILSPAEQETLLRSIDGTSAVGARDLTIVALLLDTGLRRSELVGLTLDDVHLEEQWLKVFGKGQKERIVPFGTQSARLLARYVTLFRPPSPLHDALFVTDDGDPITEVTVAMLFGRLRRRSGIARLHPHLLRHTFATSYLIAGGDVFTLQHMLGHTTLEMTRRYVALASAHVSIQHRRFSPLDRVAPAALRVGRTDRRKRRSVSTTRLTSAQRQAEAQLALLTRQP